MARSNLFTHGYVVGILVLSKGDSDDEGRLPDAVASPNKPTFTRLRDQYKLPLPAPEAGAAGAFVSHVKVTTAVIQSGPHVGQLTSDVETNGAAKPNATPGVELVVGAYRVDLGLGYSPQQFEIEVTEEHTQATPLDLYSAAPYVPGQGQPVTTVLLPAGASIGDVLSWGADGLEWVDQADVPPAVVEAAVTTYLADNPLDVGVRTINQQTPDAQGNIDIEAGGGTTVHGALTGRDATDQHPMSAITGLTHALDGKQAAGDYAPTDHTHPDYLTVDDLPTPPDLTDVVLDDDPRLSDPRTPTEHDHDSRYYTQAQVDAALDTKATLVILESGQDETDIPPGTPVPALIFRKAP